MIIQRPVYLQKLIERRDNGMVKVITGLRRCGKTFLVKNLYHDWLVSEGIPSRNIIIISLDQNSNARFRNPILLDAYLRQEIRNHSGRCYVILDEIQYSVDVPNAALPEEVRTKDNAITFYDTVLGLMDLCDLYVTGSNSEMLSSDILTNFRGRGDEVHVYPLSFAEFLSVWEGESQAAFREYLYHGGMPAVLSYKTPDAKGNYLKRLFEKTYLADLVERYKIQYPDDLGRVLDFIASSIGSSINVTNIANRFGGTVSRNTVAEYIDHMQNAFLISEAKRFDIRGKEYITGQQKYYFTDLGLRNARLNFRQFDRARLIENAVYNELITRGYSVDVGRVQAKVKNASGGWQAVTMESDFVVNDLDRRIYIQVTEGIDDPGKKEQEMASLRHIRDGFPKMLLIDQDVPEHRTETGVIIMSIQDFLLQKPYHYDNL